MNRLVNPLHVASFALSGLLAWTSLASAAPEAPLRRGAPKLSVSAEPRPLPRLLPERERAAQHSWSAKIDATLEGLRASAMVPHRERGLGQRLDAILHADATRSTVAMHVRDLDDDRVLFDRRGGWHLNPASNQKIMTAHAAVELLGADYRFETRLLRSEDTLIIRGEGDPSLSVAALDGMLREAKAKGELEGVRHLRVDTAAFDAQRFAPGVDEHEGEDAYLAPTGPLSMTFNTVELTVRPAAKLGAAPQLDIYPPSDGVVLVNDARTGSGDLQIHSEAMADGRTRIRVSGAISSAARPKTERRRIHDPARFVAGSLTHLADAVVGEQAWTYEEGPTPEGARLVASHRSASLVDVLAASMKYSNNFTTEQVLRTLAWRATGEPGSFEAGVELLDRFSQRVSSVEDETQLVNGSGLTHEGRVSPRLLVDLLALSARPGSPSAALMASYARAGGEGTLHYRNAAAGSRVRAKTGTLAGVSALSGVVYSSDGSRRVGFSLLVNGADATDTRAMQDRAVAELLRWLDDAS